MFEAEQISLEIKDTLRMAMLKGNIGYVYYNFGKLDSAEIYLREAYKLNAEQSNDWGTAINLAVLGGLLVDEGRDKEAASCLYQAKNFYEQQHSVFWIATVYLDIAKLQRKRNAWDSAFYYANKSLTASKAVADSFRLIVETGNLLSELYERKNDYEKALYFYKLSSEAKDTVYGQEKMQKLMTLEFQEKEKEKEIIAAKKEFQNRLLLYSAFGVVIIFLMIAVLLYRNNRQQKVANVKIAKEKKRSDELLLNILPSETAEELKATGTAEAKSFDEVTVMFTDFKNFTQASEQMNAKELVSEINYIFSEFDKIISKHNIEKIKTIGDSYMCAGGLPVANKTNASDIVNAALEIQQFTNQLKEEREREKENKYFFEIRIGIHSGPVVAGIVGIKKFAYDIWGDTVNIASRMESSGEAGKINISGSTYELVKDKFTCTHRGKIQAKNKGEVDMYFVVNYL